MEADILARLAELYPATFFLAGTDRRPLKIGISRDLQAAETGLSKHRIRRAPALYTSSLGYLSNMREGVARIGLDGKPAGAVDPLAEELHAIARTFALEAEAAAEWRKAREARQAARKRRQRLERRVASFATSSPSGGNSSPAKVPDIPADAVSELPTKTIFAKPADTTAPKRLSPADLRAAARARQQAAAS